MRFNRRALLLLVACVALGGGASRLAAQNVGSVRGRVVEGSTLRPLVGVQVTVPGTGRGALTDATGVYLINNVPPGSQTVRADMLGYSTVQRPTTVTAGQAAVVDFELAQTVLALNELVVTGVPGATSRRTLGNSITKLDAAALTEKTVVSNVQELLMTQTPGLTFLPNSGVPGAAGEMRIRGAGSLAVSGMPVVYVDGVRFNTGSYGSFVPSGAGNINYRGQTTSALDGIDPSEIESIEVIKGPAAATLYGAEAAAGVIQIITKRGKLGQQSMRWNTKLEYGGNSWAVEIPNNYTTCDVSRLADAAGWPGCVGKPVGTVLVGNPLKNDPAALRTGEVRRLSLQLQGGGDNFSYFVDGSQDNEQGVFYNSFQNRSSLRANFMLAPSNKVDFSVSSNYVRSNLRLPLGDESAEGLLLSAYRGRPGRTPPGGVLIRDGWGGTAAVEANAYDNTTVVDRVVLGTTLNYRPFTWFKNRVTLGLDYMGSQAQVLSLPNSIDAQYAGYPEGLVSQRVPRNYVYSLDYAGNLDRQLTNNLLATTSFGLQYIGKQYKQLNAWGTGLAVPDVTLIGSTQVNYGSNSYSEQKSLGMFAEEKLGWKDRLYVTGAVRVDNNSSFGENIKRYTYPKASLSWVASDEPALRGIFQAARIDNFKFRTAWGRAGNAPDPYQALQTYTVTRMIKGPNINSMLRLYAQGNPNLKPEKGQEFEIGFESGMLKDRAGVDFTYYRKEMKDALIAATVPGSSGFAGSFSYGMGTVYQNLGQTLNEGLELSLRATPVLTRHLTWEARVDLGTNRNRLVSFGDPMRTYYAVAGQSYGTVQYHIPGFPLGAYFAPKPMYNADTLVWTASTGLAQLDTACSSIAKISSSKERAQHCYIGSSQPTRQLGFSNTFTVFRNVRIYALFDYKGGFYNYNARESQRCRVTTQYNCERINDPANVDLTNMNLVQVPPKNPMVRVWRLNATNNGYWIEPADFIKFRDLSLTYTVPTRFLGTLRARSLSLTGAMHNVGIVWKRYSGPDPEVNSYGDMLYYTGQYGFARADVYPLPMIRRMTFSANVSF